VRRFAFVKMRPKVFLTILHTLLITIKKNKMTEKCNAASFLVAMSNELVVSKAATALSKSEARIIYAALSKVNSMPGKETNSTVELDADFFKSLFSLTIESTYRIFRDFKTNVIDKGVYIKTEAEQTSIKWFDSIDYANKDGKGKVLTLTFSKDICSHILNLGKRKAYTSIKLKDLLPFESNRSMRLYFLIRSRMINPGDKKKMSDRTLKDFNVSFNIDELRNVLNIKEETNIQFKQFNRDVLKKVINEIAKVHCLQIDLKYLKRKQKIELIISQSDNLLDNTKKTVDSYLNSKKIMGVEEKKVRMNKMIKCHAIILGGVSKTDYAYKFLNYIVDIADELDIKDIKQRYLQFIDELDKIEAGYIPADLWCEEEDEYEEDYI